MIVYPAIDLMGGRCVRLAQGRFESATAYSDDPEQAMRDFADKGAEWVHIVDLDGARAGAPIQHERIAALAAEAPLRVQLAGGFRTRAQIAAMIDAGIDRVVVGTLAVTEPDMVRSLIAEYGADRITLALDVTLEGGEPRVATSGWLRGSKRSLWDVAGEYPEARHLLVTDISRDGMLGGPNIALASETVRRFPHLALQASGGVASLEDVAALVPTGAAGVIIGKALWEGRFTLEEALRHARA
ncbi:MAG: 1-(5-phosphoribosyl)-5-[(5-phosphoribosylamino)methylideneamino]imidazole-4-carboxamide isomerase [Parasphingopyxis sp.]|nr:1-(5-phosphoribosyl)-5-[(5-phosphoribosylamino)methylideneamino]imidazole-4-carboxamide isomerase [Sphingomonadales bacterium]